MKQNTTTTAAGTTTTAATEEGAEDVGIEDIPAELDLTEEEGAALFLEVAEGEAPGAVGYFTALMAMNEAL